MNQNLIFRDEQVVEVEEEKGCVRLTEIQGCLQRVSVTELGSLSTARVCGQLVLHVSSRSWAGPDLVEQGAAENVRK